MGVHLTFEITYIVSIDYVKPIIGVSIIGYYLLLTYFSLLKLLIRIEGISL